MNPVRHLSLVADCLAAFLRRVMRRSASAACGLARYRRGLVLLALGGAVAAARPPNIVLILADDLGYGDLACYGATDIRTPNIDRLAAKGTRFTSFCVAQGVCTASRAALFTGCYSNRVDMSGALNHLSQTGLHPRETLLSELLKREGYATAIFGKWHLGDQPPFLPTRRGFDSWLGIPYSNDNGPLHPVTKNLPALPFYENETIIERDPDQSQFTRRLTEGAVDFITANRGHPFFLYVPHIMPHVPIFVSDRFRGSSRRGLYGDVVQELDWSVGEILAAIESCGLERDTLVLFASDNGPFLSYGDHAGSSGHLRGGKLTAFEGGVRTPLIACWHGRVPSGRVTNELFSEMDLLPTLAKLAGAGHPTLKIDGQDLSPFLLGERGAVGRREFWYYNGDELHAVRLGKWKLHLPHEYLEVAAEPGRDGKPSNWGRMKPMSHEQSGIRGIASRHGYRVERIGLVLYDLETDPGETLDLAAEHPEIVAELQGVAARARASLGDMLTGISAAEKRPAGDARVLGSVPASVR
ncbi:MAG: sulfatase [Opitutaceae bacterium]|nr:sulfatase [Opitutaceae bacterium]